MERRLLDLCDHVAYVSHDLFERERESVADAQFLGHGVTSNDSPGRGRATALGPSPPASAAPPADRRLLRRDGRLPDGQGADDQGRPARRAGDPGPDRPGTDNLSTVKAEPNVVHIGQMLPEELPCTPPTSTSGSSRSSQWFYRLCNPIKLQEYLALGFPIVATSLPAYEPFEGLVSTAITHDEFLGCLDRAIDDHDPELARSRRAAVLGNDWERVTSKMARMLACPA